MTAGYWDGPSDELAGVVVPVARTLIRRTDIGLVLTHATAYPTGFLLHPATPCRPTSSSARKPCGSG